MFSAIAAENLVSFDGLKNGLFRSHGSGVTPIAIQDDAAPGGSSFELFSDASINEAGQVLFRSTLSTADSSGIFLGDGNSPLEVIAQTGDAAPDGNGVFDNTSFGFTQGLALNDNGEVAFAGRMDLTSGAKTMTGGFSSMAKTA